MLATDMRAERPRGLSAAEAAERLAAHGPNRVESGRQVGLLHRVRGQLRDPLIVVLLLAMALTVATGDHVDATIISLVVVVNTVVGVLQELRADRAIAALQQLTVPFVRVVRDGREGSCPADELVPGDLVVLAEGDIVPADAQAVEAAGLLLDESSMTGESLPVPKEPGADDVLAAGTLVVHGRGLAVVTRTGADSSLGRIAAALGVAPGSTPLQRRLQELSRVLAGVAVAVCLVVLVMGVLRGQPLELMTITAISLVVAAVPESLPAVVTIALALGARRMADRRAVVRRLSAVETLGAVTIIATDKTGTLTEGRMVVEHLWTPEGSAVVTGTGYAPVGSVLTDGGAQSVDTAPALAALLRAAALCNDATLHAPTAQGEEWATTGDPTEVALLTAAAKLGLDLAASQIQHPRLDEVPFDSGRRRMSTVHGLPDGSRLLLAKGAPDVILEACAGGTPGDVLVACGSRADALAEEGFRVLAVASKRLPGTSTHPATEEENGLELLGLLAIADPPRAEAAATVAACRAAGIIPVLITGDHLATAANIAGRLGIFTAGDRAVSGAELAEGRVPDISGVRLFARTTPDQKLDIVSALQEAGHVVAMTGDGVNDGPALRRADIGVAMGDRGTEIARQAADVVLTDDSLATVVSAVEEGRRVYANVRRFLLYGLAGGLAEILVMLLGPGIGLALPLLPAQILWVNLITHGLPGVALGTEPTEPDAMSRGPRPPTQSVLGAGLWVRILFIGAVVAVATLSVGAWADANGRPWQTMVFATLATTQLAVALGVRARSAGLQNPFLLVAVPLAFALELAAIYLPVLQRLLSTTALSSDELLLTCAVAVSGYVAARLVRTPRRGTDR